MKNKKIIILIILILISILTLIGSSYALLTKTFTSKKLSVEVGTLKVDFTEGNAINLDNTKPMSDSDGLNTTPYTFTITNSGTIDSYYTISNEEDTNNTLDTTYLKYKLVSNDGYDSGIKRLKDIGTGTYRIVDERALLKSKSVTYKLYLWIASDASNNIQDKLYKSKIVVNSISNKGTLDMKCKSVGGKYTDGECRKYYVKLNNLIANSNFANGISWWTTNDGAYLETVNNSVATINCSNGTSTCGIYQQPLEKSIIGHKYYGLQKIRSSTSTQIVWVGIESTSFAYNRTLKQNEWYSVSYEFLYNDELKNYYHAFVFYIQSEFNNKFYIENPIYVDLTLMFGSGNEPSKEWCDKNLNRYIEYSETGIKTPISSINYTGNTSYYDVIDISK